MDCRIKEIRICKAKSAMSKPIADATHTISEIGFFVIELETYSGITGQGYLLAFHYSPKAIEGALRDVRSFILEKDYQVFETLRMKADYERENEYFGNTGLLRWAQAIMNIAMWDTWGKTVGLPIWKMLGSNGRKINVYGSGGWLNYSDEELLDEVKRYKARGFKAVKIKVGSEDIQRDVRRLTLVREQIGTDLHIMMDANQGMSVTDSIKLAEQVKKLNIHWFEEPISNTDISGYEIIRNKTGISLAMGEREFDTETLKSLIKCNALDLWQPDLLRIGGVEAWRNSAALAAAYHIPCLPHYYKDYDVPLLATIPNSYGAESFDWIDSIIDRPMEIKDGYAIQREGNGWGFSFLEKYLQSIE
jgi:L-alanine-DL-glutamate epimerase-like enolase superfamily enzyme